jgi:hypothetical protein
MSLRKERFMCSTGPAVPARRLVIVWLLGLGMLDVPSSKVAATTISGLSQLGGWVYIDRNNDGQLAFSNDPDPEFAIGGIDVSLFSQAGSVTTLISTIQSDEFGRYLFENINPGTYKLVETQSADFVDGRDTLGILESLNGQPIPGSASPGAARNDSFSNIVLTADVAGEFYNFGERGLTAGAASKRFLFATAPPNTPPPGGTPPGTPPLSEPSSLLLAITAVCGACLASRRVRGN